MRDAGGRAHIFLEVREVSTCSRRIDVHGCRVRTKEFARNLPQRPSHKVDGSGRPYTKTASRGAAGRVSNRRPGPRATRFPFPLKTLTQCLKPIMPSVKEHSAKLVADVTSATVTSPSSTTTPRLHPHVAPLATGTELGRRVVRRAPDRSGSIRHVSRRTMPRFLVLAAWAHAPVPMKPLLRVLAALTKA